jgi:hypothetical protein
MRQTASGICTHPPKRAVQPYLHVAGVPGAEDDARHTLPLQHPARRHVGDRRVVLVSDEPQCAQQLLEPRPAAGL